MNDRGICLHFLVRFVRTTHTHVHGTDPGFDKGTEDTLSGVFLASLIGFSEELLGFKANTLVGSISGSTESQLGNVVWFGILALAVNKCNLFEGFSCKDLKILARDAAKGHVLKFDTQRSHCLAGVGLTVVDDTPKNSGTATRSDEHLSLDGFLHGKGAGVEKRVTTPFVVDVIMFANVETTGNGAILCNSSANSMGEILAPIINDSIGQVSTLLEHIDASAISGNHIEDPFHTSVDAMGLEGEQAVGQANFSFLKRWRGEEIRTVIEPAFAENFDLVELGKALGLILECALTVTAPAFGLVS